MKRVLIATALGLVLAVLTTALLMNSHIDIFPCEKRDTMKTPPGPWHSGTCDYPSTTDDIVVHDGRFTGAGWAVFALVGVLVPFGIGAGVGAVIARPKRK